MISSIDVTFQLNEADDNLTAASESCMMGSCESVVKRKNLENFWNEKFVINEMVQM